MAKELTQTAQSLLVLLNNIDELIVRSNNRKYAREVMRAFTVYAHGKNFQIPTDKIENFHAILLDGRPETISFIIKDIAGDIIKKDNKNDVK